MFFENDKQSNKDIEKSFFKKPLTKRIENSILSKSVTKSALRMGS